jgi:hypothetical protein
MLSLESLLPGIARHRCSDDSISSKFEGRNAVI